MSKLKWLLICLTINASSLTAQSFYADRDVVLQGYLHSKKHIYMPRIDTVPEGYSIDTVSVYIMYKSDEDLEPVVHLKYPEHYESCDLLDILKQILCVKTTKL